jgi:hypothetical protein
MRLKSFESFFNDGDFNSTLRDTINQMDNYFSKNVEKQYRIPLLKMIERNIIIECYRDLLDTIEKLKKDRSLLKKKNKKLGQELQTLMNNRKLEKRKIEILEHEILFQ